MGRPAIHPLEQRPLRNRYALLKYRAQERGVAFTLTFDQFAALAGQPCHYCGGTPNPGNIPGIDRVTAGGGYTPENTVSACGPCNLWKNTLTPDEFREHIRRLYEGMVLGIKPDDGYTAPPLHRGPHARRQPD